MKKIILITALLISGLFVEAQTYTCELQIDMALSGNKKAVYEKATLIFSEKNGKFSIKYDRLNNTEIFDIFYLDKAENGNEPYVIYAINNSLHTGYDALKVVKFKKPIKLKDKSYSLCFTIIKFNSANEVSYYTAFYINKN